MEVLIFFSPFIIAVLLIVVLSWITGERPNVD